MFSLWVKFSADDILKYFSYVSQKTDFDITCILSHVEKICKKFQSLFFWNNKKNIINLMSSELAHVGIKVKIMKSCDHIHSSIKC